ncbi:uncharacterized protein LOC111612600 [Centruroides sculpturatus]|uniref:uncharacterized protein LOC111612600 n=1 Tax=Centruroides sculpturatus TaxID=218467 RepID=UPI000C6DF0F0|nr:uncharacterized protein LOC111612600 [Centruroides sculpturatus]
MATAITIILITLILPAIINYQLNENGNGRRWTIKTSFWFLFSCFTNKGSDISYVNRLFARIAVGTCIVTILILTFSYSGTLTSHLTAHTLEPVPKTFVELLDYVKKGKIACGTHDSSYVNKIIMKSDKGFLKDIRDHIVSNNNFYGMTNMMPRAKKGRIGLISYDMAIKIWTSNDEEKWFISDDALKSLPYAFPMRKGFPLKNKFDSIISRFIETGVTSKTVEDIRYKNQKTVRKFEALDLTNFLGAFSLLLAGYSLAIICFILELFIGKQFRNCY